MLLEAIRMGDQFWTMAEQTKFTDVVDTIYYEVHYCTPWVSAAVGGGWWRLGLHRGDCASLVPTDEFFKHG